MTTPYVAYTDVTERGAIAQTNGLGHDVDVSVRAFQPSVISTIGAMARSPALTLPNIKASVSEGMRPTIRRAWGTLSDTWVDAGGDGYLEYEHVQTSARL